jgi:hypothetical protein
MQKPLTVEDCAYIAQCLRFRRDHQEAQGYLFAADDLLELFERAETEVGVNVIWESKP